MNKNIVFRRVPIAAAFAALGTMLALCGSSAPSRQSAGSDHTFTAVGSGGWQLISAPYTYSQSFQQMAMYTAAWQPQQNSYAVTPTPPADAFHFGQGYWAYLTNNTTLPAGTGSADTTQNFSIPLQPGWNMVGDPFTNSVPLTNLYFLDTQTGLSTQLPAAAATNTISPLFSYDPTAGSYTAVSDSGQSLQPWQGYWVYSLHASRLVIGNSGGGSIPEPATTDQLIAAIEPWDNPTLGIAETYVPGTPLPPASPSVANPYVVVSIQDEVRSNGLLIIQVQPPAPVDSILIGNAEPGGTGFYQITANPSQKPSYQMTFGGTLPPQFTLAVETISGGVISGQTITLMKTDAGYPYGTATGCGGGQVMALSSGLSSDTNEIAQAYLMTNLSASTVTAAGGASAITGQGPCLYDTSTPYNLNIQLNKPLVVGQTYLVQSNMGPGGSSVPAGVGFVTYGDASGGWVARTGTLTVQSVANHTMTFTAQMTMFPYYYLPGDVSPPPPPQQNSARGSFTLTLSGTVGVAGL